MNDSISERIIATCRSRRHCRKHQTWRLRRAWSEMLEPRQLLAADLAATSFDFAGGQPIRQGDAFTATVTVQNLNGIWWLDDAGAFYINVYLSDNSLISTSDMLVGAVYVSGLGAGQSTTKTIDLRSGPYKMPEFDPFRTDNEYYIGVIVDPYNDVSESNENNNANRGDGLDRERVWGERHLPSPATGTTVAADVLNLGQSATGAIGGADEWTGVYDLDTYAVSGTAGQTAAFDIDSGAFDSYLRVYDFAWTLVAQNDNGWAPGESTGNLDSLVRYTFAYTNTYYIVVSSAGDHLSDPRLMTDRSSGTNPAGSYILETQAIPAAPTSLDLNDYSDTGTYYYDNITRITTPLFTFSGQSNMIGQILANGSVVGQVDTMYGGQYQINTSPLANGTYSMTARLMDPSTGYTSDPSSPISVTIDTLAPATPPPPDLISGTDSGLSNSDNITNIIAPSFTGSAESGTMVRVFRNGLPMSTAYSNGTWNTSVNLGSDGVYYITAQAYDVAGNYGNTSTALQVTLDTVGPSFTTPISFGCETVPHRIAMAFSDDVAATLTAADLTVLDLGTSATIGTMMAYDAPTRSASFALSAIGGIVPGALPQGNYRATIGAGGVTDVAGNGIVGNTVMNFYFLPGDVVGQDRCVDTLDFNRLALNFGKTGQTYSAGDFNYDGIVNALDFNLIASRYGTTLPTGAPPIGSAPARSFSALPVHNLFADVPLRDDGIAEENLTGLV